MWILLVLYYGFAKGAREISKKLAMNTLSIIEVLILYTGISFVLVTPYFKEALLIDKKYLGLIAIKSFVIFLAWIMSSNALKKLPISLFGILDLSRMLFTTIFGVVFFKEVLSINQIFGFIIVCTGLLMLRYNKDAKDDDKDKKIKVYMAIAVFSCVFNAISGSLDKYLMHHMSSGQLQFYYLFFMLCFYVLYMLFTKQKVRAAALKNKYIWLMALLFVTGDKALFIAHTFDGAKLSLITIIQQSSVLMTIIGGKLIFKEENILYKLFCASIIIFGIFISI